MIAKTPLHAAHILQGARMVDFHGWDMPLHYGSQLEEHHIVRQHAGMFDVSHMTVVDILGAGGRQFLRKLLTNDIDQLQHNGQALYSCMCNEHGGILDDLIVYQLSSDLYRVVFNSATKDKDLAWIQSKSPGFSVGLQVRQDVAMLAVQGPEAISKTLSILTPAQADAVSTLAPFECVTIDDYFIARTGYTGEDGLEMVVPKTKINELWDALLTTGVKPCGLAARDTLRLEAGLMLYGQDMDETTSPLESGLGWTIKWSPEDRDFIGMGALISQKIHGTQRKMVGLILQDKGIMRQGQKVSLPGNDQESGIITSGTWSPSLNQSIALARVPMGTGEQVMVSIRDKQIPARVCKPRFVKHGKAINN